MENCESYNSTQKESSKQESSSLQNIESHHVDSVDKIQSQAPVTPVTNNGLTPPDFLAKETDAAISVARSNSSAPLSSNTVTNQIFEISSFRSIFVKIPSNRITMEELQKVVIDDKYVNNHAIDLSPGYFLGDRKQQRKRKFYSQTIDKSNVDSGNVETPNPTTYENQARSFSMDRQRDKRYDSFKTWSGKLERQLSNLRGKPQDPETLDNDLPNTEVETLPVARYFDALEGPELEILRDSEELVLPEDKKWPFLLRYPISSFGICLGISSQAILWKTLSTSTSTKFLHISPGINFVLWYLAVVVTVIVSLVYVLKIILYFEAVRREYYHPIRINFFFAPWISLMFLALGMPSALVQNLHGLTWYVLMAPVLFLELKIYGQWMLGGERRLSKVANPSNHLSIVGNFVGALLGASMGLKEGPIFFFSVGIAHYIVLFVTLYQRLPTNVTLPKELHPVFFLFVAAPNVASMAWARIQGSFDYGSKIAYFIAIFLYISLAVRINFFRGFKFSLAWWAYTFPMTGASIATIRYSCEVKNPITQSLAVLLSSIATLTVTGLFISTVIHAFVLQDLFPNDIAIAITEKRPKSKKKKANKKSENSESTDISISINV